MVALSGGAIFSCLSLTDEISGVQWHLNDSSSPLDDFEDNVAIVYNENAHIGVLTLTNLSMSYNGTRVQCMANFTAGMGEATSNATTLLVQGLFLQHSTDPTSYESPKTHLLTGGLFFVWIKVLSMHVHTLI